MVIEDWQRRGRAVRQHFLGGIRNVSFSQCSVVTWDSVIDCGGACWQWIVRPLAVICQIEWMHVSDFFFLRVWRRQAKRWGKWDGRKGKGEKLRKKIRGKELAANTNAWIYSWRTHAHTHWAVDAPLSVWHWCCQTNQGTFSPSHLLISAGEENQTHVTLRWRRLLLLCPNISLLILRLLLNPILLLFLKIRIRTKFWRFFSCDTGE